MSTPRLEDLDLTFLLGMDSISAPEQLTDGFYSRGINVVNRGGIAQCRPGYRCKFALGSGNLQGAFVFRPRIGLETILIAMDGKIYRSEYPYKDFSQVLGLSFVPHARRIHFVQAQQSVEINPDGSLHLIDPKNLVIMQDGGLTAAGVWDGTRGVHDRNIPIGGPMAWSGDRLWVAQGTQVKASDLSNPRAFTEPNYIATIESFTMPGQITAFAEPEANSELPQLLVFTEDSTTLLQSGIRDRSLWITTPNFQRVLFPEIGNVSESSLVRQNGLLWWYSQFGLTNLNAAQLTRQTSAIPYQDREMTDSKSRLSEDLTGIATASFENYLLVSVPYADKFNAHTWCLDATAVQRMQAQSPASWNSVWTGTRPVEWLYGLFAGHNKIFYISADYDGVNRLWEAFTPDRLDDGCPITWAVETRAYAGGIPLRDKYFRYADVFMSELYGTVDVAVFWAGPARGKYKRILTKRINASRGTIRAGRTIKAGEKLFALKKQGRKLRTQDARLLYEKETQTSCGVESPNSEVIDEAFQLLIVGSGPGAIRGIRAFMEPPQGTPGATSPNKELSAFCETDETEENFVRFDGAADESDSFDAAIIGLTQSPLVFTSNRSCTVTVGDFTEVGTGNAESVISQQDADKIAMTIACRKASHELELVLPKIISLGPELLANAVDVPDDQ